MQESRLFKILYYLLDKGSATASELADKFEVSARTIYRDIDALSGAGIPIYTEAGRNGGIYLMDHFVLDRMMLTDREKMEILSALQSVGAAGNEGGKAVFEKLSALFRMQSENWYEVDFSRWGDLSHDNEKFELLKKAILSNRRVRILYVGANREKKQRIVEPLKLLYKSRAWYLKAWCTEKESFRLFKLNRILEWEIQDETFTPMPFPEPSDDISPADTVPPQVVLSFPLEMAYRVYDEFDISQIEEWEDGSLRVTSRMPVDEWLIAFLLSFGHQVEVVEPVYLKRILAERAFKICQRNGMKVES